MELPHVFSRLYSGDSSKILSVLQLAIHTKEHPNNECITIHTGCTFTAHTGNEFHVLYCIAHKQPLYCRPLGGLPQLAGLFVGGGKSYQHVVGYSRQVLIEWNPDDFKMAELDEIEFRTIEEGKDIDEYKNFKVNESTNPEAVIHYPLRRKLGMYFMGYDGIESYTGQNRRGRYDDNYDRYDEMGKDGQDEVDSWDRDFPGWSDGRD